MKLDSGMIFASDSRTNAGVDHIATFCKMRVYDKPDDRLIVILSSGNLSMTQGVINILDRHKYAAEGIDTIWNAQSMFDVADLAGEALREMQRKDGRALAQSGIDANSRVCSMCIPKAISSRPRKKRPTSNWANRNTASRSSTAWSPPARRKKKPPSAC